MGQENTETNRTFCVRTAIPTECIDAQLEASSFAFQLPYNSEVGCAGACFSVGALALLRSSQLAADPSPNPKNEKLPRSQIVILMA